jgi:O-antigen/teichoic acid export membrane protein
MEPTHAGHNIRVLKGAIGRLKTRYALAWTFMWVSGARVTMLGLSLIGSVIIYRTLAADSPDMTQAGQFAIAMAVVRAIMNSVGSAGDLVVVRRVPVLLGSDPTAAADIVRTAFLLRIAMLLLLFITALLLRDWFAERFLHGRDHAAIVILIGTAAAGEMLLRSVISFFQASERFERFVAFEAAFQAGRLAMVLALLATGTLTVSTVLASYAAMGMLTAAVAATRLPRTVFTVSPVPIHVLREAAHYYIWTAFAFGLSAGTERADLFLLGRFRGAQEVGLYGGVLTLAIIPDFINGMLATVLQPRVASLRARGALPAFNRKFMMAMLPAGLIALVLLMVSAHTIVQLALGPRFMAGVPSFTVLAAGSIVTLMLTPVSAVLISMSAPRITMALTSVQLLMLVGGGVLLIPAYGATGAALVVAGTRIILAFAVVVIGYRLMPAPLGAEIPATG